MDQTANRGQVIGIAIVVEGSLIVLAEILGWLLHRPPRPMFHWRDIQGWAWGFAATLPMVLAFLVMLRWPIGPLARIKRFTVEILCPMLAECSLLDLLGMSVLAGLGEEMLFRGVLQGALQDKVGLALALVIASSLFGILHAITFAYAVFAALMGAYLGWLWHLTGNLLAPALAHALYDFLALAYLVRAHRRPEPVDEAKEQV